MKKENSPVYWFIGSFILVGAGTICSIVGSYAATYDMSVLFSRLGTGLIVAGAIGLAINFAKSS